MRRIALDVEIVLMPARQDASSWMSREMLPSVAIFAAANRNALSCAILHV
jgi:hypothetical protein